MHAGTGHWTTARFCEVERKRLEADRVRAAENRRKHRELDRRERLLRDLEAVDKKLKFTVGTRKPLNTLALHKRVTTLLRCSMTLKLDTPYADGFLSGTLDAACNYRSEYAWATLDDLNTYASEYSRGYHDGWNDAVSRRAA
jgi:hypothetical protein